MKRREFIVSSTLVTAYSCLTPVFSKSSDPLDILVLGGTVFVGPAVVNALMEQGHRVTLFNRGITNPELFPDLPLLKGDRTKGPSAYDPLRQKKWDVVIDVWPEKSYMVDEATNALLHHARHYVFISSIAVYKDYSTIGLNENSQVLQPSANPAEWYYGEEKVVAENLIRKRFPGNHTIVRPGPIKGWRDPATDLLYWLMRLEQNQEILGPGSGTDPLQFIDVKDVGTAVTALAESKRTGTFNCTGPTPGKLNWKEFLDSAKTHLGSESVIHFPSTEFLRQQNVRVFEDLPLWLPLDEDPGFMQISTEKLIKFGFAFTPINQTIDDCLAWYRRENLTIEVGLSESREKELITKWASG